MTDSKALKPALDLEKASSIYNMFDSEENLAIVAFKKLRTLLRKSAITFAEFDFRSALFEGANRFHAADMAAVPHVGRSTDIYLPTGGGAFVCTVVGARSGDNHFLYARAATWVDSAMLRPDQVPLPKAGSAEKSVAALLLLE